jgi:uncharacterized protein
MERAAVCYLCSRRDVVSLMAALPFWAGLPRPTETAAGLPLERPVLRAEPFALRDVRLGDGPCLEAMALNRRFLLGLDTDRLLHMFRLTAGLPSSAAPYGGWEAPDNELRGHFVGHYLSACALMAARGGEAALARRGVELVAGLARCQQAHGDGYLSAFPREFFDRLRAHHHVWAPFYTWHKIMAGLLDSYQLAGNSVALRAAEGMARWTAAWLAPLSEAEVQRILEVEHGGMTAVLLDLSAVTRETSYRDLAERFRHARILAPLAAGRDELADVHGNTTIPKILGEARRYELGGDVTSRGIAEYFWREVTGHRSYATGGTTTGEGWVGRPDQLAATLSSETQETCVSYNMLKLTRQLFTWSADAGCAEFYERAFFNGILPTQHPADGEKLYYTPLASGYWKLFGTPEQGFWCCHGTGVENFAKAGDSIYFRDAHGLYLNLFVASEVRWPEKGLRVSQETRFPEQDRVTLRIHAARPVRLALHLRIPAWTTASAVVVLNGRELGRPAEPGSYLTIERTWAEGDLVALRLPMSLHAVAMPDDPALQAFLYGPLVLAGRMGTAGITDANRRARPTAPYTVPEFVDPDLPPAPVLRAPGSDPASWIRPVAGRPLEFRTTGQPVDYTLVPLYRLFDERYALYWTVVPA